VTTYVDDMRAPVGRFLLCHMIADTESELHVMAAAIGVHRHKYQGDHYDIALSKRKLAVALGAVEITMRQASMMTVLRRRDPSAPLVSPERGRAWLRERRGIPSAEALTV
jgi:hypothetical protein